MDETPDAHGRRLVNGYAEWFWRSTERYEKSYTRCFWIGTITGVAATVFAAFPSSILQSQMPNCSEFIKWIVVVLSAVATLFNTTLMPRYRRLAEDRDKGRIRLDKLRQGLEVSTYQDADQTKLQKVIDEIAAVEAAYGGLGSGLNQHQKATTAASATAEA